MDYFKPLELWVYVSFIIQPLSEVTMVTGIMYISIYNYAVMNKYY